MSIIINLRQSIFSFTDGIPEINAQNKKMILIASALFAFIGACYAILHCCASPQKTLKVIAAKPSPILKREPIPIPTIELMEALNKKIDKTYKFCVDKLGWADHELDQIGNRFDKEINLLRQEYVKEKRRSDKTEQALIDMQKRMGDLDGEAAVRVKKDSVSFVETFNKKYCVIESGLRLFSNGIQLDDQLSDSLQQLTNKYPNLRFYFTTDPDKAKFGEAVKKGPNDAMWCIVSVTRTMNDIPVDRFSSNGNFGVAVFKWNIACKPTFDVRDMVLSVNDKVNFAPYYEGFLVDLGEDNNRKLAMDSVLAFKKNP